MVDEYWANGFDDYVDFVDRNPYPQGTHACEQWRLGWLKAHSLDGSQS